MITSVIFLFLFLFLIFCLIQWTDHPLNDQFWFIELFDFEIILDISCSGSVVRVGFLPKIIAKSTTIQCFFFPSNNNFISVFIFQLSVSMSFLPFFLYYFYSIRLIAHATLFLSHFFSSLYCIYSQSSQFAVPLPDRPEVQETCIDGIMTVSSPWHKRGTWSSVMLTLLVSLLCPSCAYVILWRKFHFRRICLLFSGRTTPPPPQRPVLSGFSDPPPGGVSRTSFVNVP